MTSMAVLVNADGLTSSITAGDSIRIYTKINDSWIIKTEINYSVDFNSGLSVVRKGIYELLQNLEDCKVFIATEINGQLYYILEANGFNSYEAAGEPLIYLDSILDNEMNELVAKENTKEEGTMFSKILEVPDCNGLYQIDLRKALALNPDLSSKKILKPFLNNKKFEVLEIICDHIPRWFESDLEAMGMKSAINRLSEKEYQITITVNK